MTRYRSFGVLLSRLSGMLVLGACTMQVARTQAPVAASASYQTLDNDVLAVTISATDPLGKELSLKIVDEPQFGVLGGTFPNLTYTPDALFEGTDSFRYQIYNGKQYSEVYEITVLVRYHGVVYLRADGDDGTAEMGDPAKAFLTTQAAVDAAIAAVPAVSRPIVIDVGTGTFGDVTLTQNFGDHVTWRGEGAGASAVGDIIASGTTGAAGDSSDPNTSTNGSPGTAGFAVKIDSNFTVSFGGVNTRGGDGGGRFSGTDGNSTYSGAAAGGGDIWLSGIFTGAINSSGGDGYQLDFSGGSNGAAAGDVWLADDTEVLSISADGGRGGPDGSGGYNGARAGDVTLGERAQSGTILARGGHGNSAGAGGTVVLQAYAKAGNIDASGGNGLVGVGTAGGGGSVELMTYAIAGTISVDSKDGWYGANAGEIILRAYAVAEDLSASAGVAGELAKAGNGGEITIEEFVEAQSATAAGGDNTSLDAGDGGLIVYSLHANLASPPTAPGGISTGGGANGNPGILTPVP